MGIDRPLGVVGGAVLVLMAVRPLRAAVSRPSAEMTRATQETRRLDHPIAAYATMVGLTLTNPATLLSFAALFAAIGATAGGAGPATVVVIGVFAGSVAWWLILTGVVTGLRARLTPGVVRGLNVVSALAIGGFGIAALGLGLAG